MNWKRVSIVLAVLLGLSLVALVGVGVWAYTSGPSSRPLGAATVQPTAGAANAGSTDVPPTAATPPIQAPTVTQNPQGAQGALAGVFGTVVSVNGSQVGVANAQGKSRVLNITTQTKMVVTGVASPSIADIKQGDKLLVFGTRQGADGLEPRALVVAPASYTRNNIKAGQVQSASQQTMTLLVGQNPVIVNIDANTQILGQLLQPIPVARLENATAVIIGQPGNGGTFVAELIIARPAAANSVGTPAH